MSYYGDKDFWLEVEKGNIPGHSIIHKFGRNAAVGTDFAPIAIGGVYATRQVAGAATLRVKAGGHVNDTAGGSGAQEVTFQGLSPTGALISEAVATAGLAASASTTLTFIRLFRSWVSDSGSYATATQPSHAGSIVIEDSAGAEDWGTIANTDFGRSQTNIAVYSVPLTFTAYIRAPAVNVDSNKSCAVLMFKRENILETAAPYTAMRLLREYSGMSGFSAVPDSAEIRLPALTDIGFMGKMATGDADVSVHFDLMLVED